jgi:hypothetical protein
MVNPPGHFAYLTPDGTDWKLRDGMVNHTAFTTVDATHRYHPSRLPVLASTHDVCLIYRREVPVSSPRRLPPSPLAPAVPRAAAGGAPPRARRRLLFDGTPAAPSRHPNKFSNEEAAEWLGRTITREFEDECFYDGTIDSYTQDTENNETLLHVSYEDGDEEELYFHEASALIQFALECTPRRRRASKQMTLEYEVKYAQTIETTQSLQRATDRLEKYLDKHPLSDGRWTVVWDWRFVPKGDVGLPWLERFEQKHVERRALQKKDINLAAPNVTADATYEVDLRTTAPHADTYASDHIQIAPIADAPPHTLGVFNRDGELRANLSESTVRHLFNQYADSHPQYSAPTFLSELLSLVERYSDHRAAAHNPATLRAVASEWSTPGLIRQRLAKLLHIQHELFTHPLNSASCFETAWSADPRDTAWGHKTDAFSWNWHEKCFMAPGSNLDTLHKAVKHALVATRTSPIHTPTFTLAFLPMFDGPHMDLLNDPAVTPMWHINGGTNLHLSPPTAWAPMFPPPL